MVKKVLSPWFSCIARDKLICVKHTHPTDPSVPFRVIHRKKSMEKRPVVCLLGLCRGWIPYVHVGSHVINSINTHEICGSPFKNPGFHSFQNIRPGVSDQICVSQMLKITFCSETNLRGPGHQGGPPSKESNELSGGYCKWEPPSVIGGGKPQWAQGMETNTKKGCQGVHSLPYPQKKATNHVYHIWEYHYRQEPKQRIMCSNCKWYSNKKKSLSL